MRQAAKSIVLDTDVGTDADDALALGLALRSPDLALRGVTTVHGNATLRAAIARRLLELAGRPEVPVVAGRSEPMRRSAVEGFHWHGVWGHEGRGLLPAEELVLEEAEPLRDAAAAFIAETVAQHPGEVGLVAIGPLTNVARAFELEPRLGELVADVTIMGGLVDAAGFPLAPHFETNLNADPAAAEIVLRSGAPITLVPAEVTRQVFLNAAQRAELGAGDELCSALGRLVGEMREAFASSQPEERTYLHDPLAVHAATRAEHVLLRHTHVEVVMDGATLRTVERPGRTPNMRVCAGVDGPAFAQATIAAMVSHAPSSP